MRLKNIPFAAFLILGIAANAHAQNIDIPARVDGFIKRIHVRENDKVRKGDLLLELDARELEARLQHAKADVNVAEAKLDLKKVELARAEKLRAVKAIAAGEYDTIRAETVAAEAELQRALAQLKVSAIVLEHTRVVAPADGRVVMLKADAGAAVKTGDVLVKLETGGPAANPAIRELQKERHAALKRIAEAMLERVKAGAIPLRDAIPAQRAALEAGLELCETLHEHIALLRQDVQLMEDMLRRVEAQFKAGLATETDLLGVRAQMLESRIRLLREEAKLPKTK